MKFIKFSILPALLLFTACLESNDPYNDVEDLAYLEEYAQKSDVTTTESGLMYRIIEQSEEGYSPAPEQLAIVSYEGESVSGEYVFSTETEQADFTIIRPEDMISFSGIGEGVQLMKEGDRYEFVLPSELAMNDKRVLTFDLELLSVIRENQAQYLENNATLEGVESTASGLQYRVLEEGTGESPVAGNQVSVRYKGYYTSGFVFDQSSGNSTVPLNVSNVIPGFSEGLRLMKEGGKIQLFVPPSLGYGNQPPQYGETILVFDVELVEIN